MDENRKYICHKPPAWNPDYLAWGAIIVIIVLAAAVRYHLLEVPLERDEGEYAYAGQLILKGIPPYKYAYNMKMPGIYAAYSAILLAFGQTHAGVHLGLLVINAATVVLIFLLGRRLFDPLTGVMAGAAFAALSLGGHVQGMMTHAEHFVILFSLGGALLLLRAAESWRPWTLFLSGLLPGVGFLMKQHGTAFILFSFLYLMWKLIKRPSLPPKAPAWRLAIFSIGALLPFALTCLALYLTGVFDRFWFWTFTYAREYVSLLPLVNGLRILKAQTLNITGSSPLIWAFTAAGASAILWDRDARGRYPFLLLFFLFSFFAVLPGFYFRGHYFILMLPASALLFGAAMGSIRRLFSRLDRPALKTAPLFLAAASVGLSLYNEREILFIASPDEVSRIIYGAYGPTPFPESIEIARYIKGHSKENDRIAVLGSEPQIYFYSNRPSATGYIYTYPMMEAHRYALKMQEEMIRDIESERPVFLVYVNIPRSWHAGKPAERLIFDWLERYIPEHYEAAGIADIISKDHTDYIWGDEAERRVPSSKYWVGVYRRKDMLNRGRP